MSKTHGETGRHITREYRAWGGAIGRCYNPSDKKFKHYGGRGIGMSPEWREDYRAFLADMGRCPAGHSLDRIDVNGPYTKDNCRWADALTHRRNKRVVTADTCRRGHAYTVENTYWNPTKYGRECRACRSEASRRCHVGAG